MRRAAKLVCWLLWLLSSSLAFGQSRLSPSDSTPQSDSDPFYSSQPGPVQIPNSIAVPSPQLVPLQGLPGIQAEGRSLFSLPGQANSHLSTERKIYTFESAHSTGKESTGFKWGPALGQSFLFLGIEHSIRLAFDPPSRTALGGKFWKQYVASLREVGQWGDGNPAFINYLGHPMQGSIVGFIQIQNDPRNRSQSFSWTQRYWNSRLKALAWSAAYSTYFEIGFPFSEAAMGNLGVDKSRQTQQGLVDLVITPTLGLGWLVSEDLIDKYVVQRFERSHAGKAGQAVIRSVLNPTRSASNALRFKPPWHRDGRNLGTHRSNILKTALQLNREDTKENRPPESPVQSRSSAPPDTGQGSIINQ